MFGRAAKLLAKVLARGVDASALATDMVMTSRELEEYRSGRKLMPLDRQLCLALVVIESVPELAREGRTLRAQVAAAAAFHAAETTTHTGPPEGTFGFPHMKSPKRPAS